MDRLQERVRAIRSRVAVRHWEYGQREHAGGVWYELRRVLADAERAYVLSQEEAEALVAAGHAVHPAGNRVEPPKTIVVTTPSAIARLESAREIEVGLNADFLEASAIALVPFANR